MKVPEQEKTMGEYRPVFGFLCDPERAERLAELARTCPTYAAYAEARDQLDTSTRRAPVPAA